MMASLEQEYYEFDGFWNPDLTPLGETDLKRVEDIYNIVPPDTDSILDVGCGNGIFCNFVKQQRRVSRIVGMDRSKAALKYVMAEKILGSMTEIPYTDKEFDCVTSLEVLEHLPIQTFVAAKGELARVAKKYIIVSVPNNQILGEGMTQCPSCKTKFDPDLHMRSFNHNTMHSLFSDHGFVCKRVEEIGWYSNYKGIQAFWRMFQHKEELPMASPLCPICGYSNNEFLRNNGANGQMENIKPRNSTGSFIKNIAKKYWPKVEGSYWLVGLYIRAK
jgi:cyclopropane fatty-acyl-phospholipid synthase-like methyltransferase